jgi:hypothetical protein
MAVENYRSHFDEMIVFHNERGRDDRFEYAKVRRGEAWYFLKHAPTSELVDHLRREQQWSEFMTHVSHVRPDAMVEAPTLVEAVDDSTFLFGWIDAPHLSEQNDLRIWQDNIKRYAQVLHVLDVCGEGWSPTIENGIKDLARAHNPETRWQLLLGKNINSVERLDEARDLVKEYDSTLVTQFQHGDLSPWQVFNEDSKWIIYDGEFAGFDLAKYNDLSYGYCRLATTLRSPQTAALLLKEFLAISEVDYEAFFRQFLPVLTNSTVGMISDAINDEGRLNYRTEANSLLDKCLERRLDVFLKV